MSLPAGYTTVTWAALTESQRISVAFAELDDSSDFVSNTANAPRFAWAGNYLLVHRPLTNTSNTRTQVYANLESRVKAAEQIAAMAVSPVSGKQFLLSRVIPR